VILAAALIGYLCPGYFAQPAGDAANDGPPALLDEALRVDPGRAARMAGTARRAGLVALLLWLIPVAVLLLVGGIYADIAWFFSKMAIVTFGGAYAVLAYVAQDAVQGYHWLSAAEMLSGLGLAETTPGPLILVLQFVGFLAGYRAPGTISGLAGGIAASALTLWVTFAPCFAMVFLGAPLIERLRGNHALSGALAAVTAAVVGVIGNLAIWFGLHVLFLRTLTVHVGPLLFEAPVLASLDLMALLLALLAAWALLWHHIGVAKTMILCVVASIVAHYGLDAGQ
jgi:chromate transporter